MEIAGVDFLISGEPTRQLKRLDPVYESFNDHAVNPSEALALHIRLQFGEMPKLDQFEKIFDTGESWSMYRTGDEYWLSLQPPDFESPFWLARFKQKAAEVCVYCHPGIVEKKNGKAILDNPVCYPLDQLLLMYFLAQHQGVLVHAAGMIVADKAMIFPGHSGAGKSTLARLFVQQKKREVVSDERMVIRKINGNFKAFGTPWSGTEGIALNKGAPLAAVFFLKHGAGNHIQKIKADDALEKLLPVCSIPWYDHETMTRIMLVCKDFAAHIPIYELSFKPDDSLIGFFEEFMSAEIGTTDMHP